MSERDNIVQGLLCYCNGQPKIWPSTQLSTA